MEIKNSLNEFLETLIDGCKIDNAKIVVIYNHGFGTDLHERGLSDEIVNYLDLEKNKISFVRMSYSGYGKSEGKQENKTLDTMAEDLVSIWKYTDKNRLRNSKIITISFSMGNQILTKAYDKYQIDIDKMICVNPMSFTDSTESKKKWEARPGVIYKNNIMNIPRADGSITKLSSQFWDSINSNLYRKSLTYITKKFNSYLIRATEDDIVDNKDVLELPFKHIIELKGNHNFSQKKDRENFLKNITKVII